MGGGYNIDEVITDNCGIVWFAELLTAYVAEQNPDHEIELGWGDSAGNQRSHSDERTALEIMQEHTGWKIRPKEEFSNFEVEISPLYNSTSSVVPKLSTLKKLSILIPPAVPIIYKKDIVEKLVGETGRQASSPQPTVITKLFSITNYLTQDQLGTNLTILEAFGLFWKGGVR